MMTWLHRLTDWYNCIDHDNDVGETTLMIMFSMLVLIIFELL